MNTTVTCTIPQLLHLQSQLNTQTFILTDTVINVAQHHISYDIWVRNANIF